MIELTIDNFKEMVLESDKVTLVDFWAIWCGPCRNLSPIIEDIDVELGDKINVGKVDVQNQQDLAKEWNVTAIPTVLVFKDGKINESFVGFHPKQVYSEHLQSLL